MRAAKRAFLARPSGQYPGRSYHPPSAC